MMTSVVAALLQSAGAAISNLHRIYQPQDLTACAWHKRSYNALFGFTLVP
jgi:hypothetical protein